MSNLPIVGTVVISIDNPIAQKGMVGVVVRQDENTFAGQPSVICVFENSQYAEYLTSDFDVEVSFLPHVVDEINRTDLCTDQLVIQAIKQGYFDEYFLKLRESQL